MVSEANEELNNYLVSEELMDRTLTNKRKEIKTSTVKHNKTKKLFNFILSKYLEVEIEEPTKEKIPKESEEEEPEEIIEESEEPKED